MGGNPRWPRDRDSGQTEPRDWRDRFRAPSIHAASRAADNRRRGVVIADHEGNRQAYAWDVASGQLGRVSDTRTAVLEAAIRPNGSAIIYHRDATGSEFGHLHSVPFGGGRQADLTPHLDDYVVSALRAQRDVVVAIAGLGGSEFLLCVTDSTVQLWAQDASALCIEVADDGSSVAVGEAMRGMYARTVVRSLRDGSVIDSVDFSYPGAVHGNEIALAAHRDGRVRPTIWTPRGDLHDLPIDLPGEVEPTGWSADGATILLYQRHRANAALHLYDVGSATTTLLPMPAGASWPWGRPELAGRVATVVWSGARTPWQVLEVDGRRSQALLRVAERAEYAGAEWRDVEFPATDGTQLQGWLLAPPVSGPWPTIVYAHGGPTAAATPMWHPFAQAWADHGYAVLSVNYRGSTTFGDAYREALTGHVGIVDVEDIVAARHWAIASRVAMPGLVLLNGFSWGGYLVLQTLATHPTLFTGGIAGSPITDFVGERDEVNPLTLAYTDTLFGGDVATKIRALRRASPRTHVEDFADPVLITTADADSRTPLTPIREFVDAMRAAGKEIQLDVFPGGHMGAGPEDDIRLMESWIAFADGITARRLAERQR